MTTIRDVAKKAGVSASTVSRALSGRTPVDEDTKQRVLEAVKALNYHPNTLARGLKEGKTGTIGLLIPNIRNPVFPAVARGVEDAARRQGYTVILCNTDEDTTIEQEYIHTLRKMWVDGMIFATAGRDSHHLIELKDSGFPVVLLIRHMEDALDAVITDNFQAAYEAVSYLIEKGHGRIALVSGSLDLPLYKERYNGYRQALMEAGQPVSQEIIIEDVEDSNGYRAMDRLLDAKDLPDAVFAMSDPMAMGVIRAIKDRGLKVPNDISVIGFDDLEMSALLDPPLTTVSQPLYELGTAAADRLIQCINSKQTGKAEIMRLKTRLVVRKSTRNAKTQKTEKE